jgi:FemAB-related protein (PEP-CTERM system-associated)
VVSQLRGTEAVPEAPRRSGRATVVRRWTDGASWDAFVAAAPDGTVAHRWPWLRVVAETYGHPTFALGAVRGGTLTGVLPLVLVRSRIFGRHLVSMPYLDCGGICSAGDADAEEALLASAVAMAADAGAPLELRHRTPRPYALPASTHKVTMTLDLAGGEPAVWQRIKSNRRGQVRKAQRNGLTAEIAGPEAVDALFSVLATNMRDLGSPMHRRSFFRNTVLALGDDARILLVRHEAEVVGAGLLLAHGDSMVLPFSSALRSTFSLGTNQFLYWEAVRYALACGCRLFDFGRSSPGSGTFEAKREWAAEPVQLYWYGSGGDAAEISRPRQLAVRAWQRLPVPVATAGGHLIRGGLPQ